MEKILGVQVPIDSLYNWMERDNQPKSEKTPARRPSKLDPFKPCLDSRLERFDLSATVLLQEIRKDGYTGGITIFRDTSLR